LLLLLFAIIDDDDDDGGGVVICSTYTFKLGLVSSAVVKCLLVGVFPSFGEDSENDELEILLLGMTALFGESTCESGLLVVCFAALVVVFVGVVFVGDFGTIIFVFPGTSLVVVVERDDDALFKRLFLVIIGGPPTLLLVSMQ
jgi:hypothetical protein